MSYIGIVYDYDEVAPIVCFGPFFTEDQAQTEAQAYIQDRVDAGAWAPSVLSEHSDISVIVEPLFFNRQHFDNWKENNRDAADDRNV